MRAVTVQHHHCRAFTHGKCRLWCSSYLGFPWCGLGAPVTQLFLLPLFFSDAVHTL